MNELEQVLNLISLTQLQSITIGNDWIFEGDRLFRNKNGILSSIILPSSITSINNKEIVYKQLESYTIPSNVTKLNDYCFAWCTQLQQLNGIERIKEIGNRCSIGCCLKIGKQYPVNYLQQFKLPKHYHLEEWTNLECNEIIFDSMKDNWSMKTNNLNDKIKKRKQLVFIIEDEDNEIFGFYFNNQIKSYELITESDHLSFYFNTQSNGRFTKPMKFNQKCISSLHLYENKNKEFFTFGDIHLMKKEYKNKSYCYDIEEYGNCNGNYLGFECALCGKSGTSKKGDKFIPKRILVLQMK